MREVRCMDCGAPYKDMGLDVTLPDEQWANIHDSEGGILCGACIAKRAAKLPGAIAIRAHIEFAPPPANRSPLMLLHEPLGLHVDLSAKKKRPSLLDRLAARLDKFIEKWIL